MYMAVTHIHRHSLNLHTYTYIYVYTYTYVYGCVCIYICIWLWHIYTDTHSKWSPISCSSNSAHPNSPYVCVTVRCYVLQYAAVCCIVLQCVAANSPYVWLQIWQIWGWAQIDHQLRAQAIAAHPQICHMFCCKCGKFGIWGWAQIDHQTRAQAIAAYPQICRMVCFKYGKFGGELKISPISCLPHLHEYVCVCTYTDVYVCVHKRMYTSVWVYIHTYMHLHHTQMYTSSQFAHVYMFTNHTNTHHYVCI